MLFSISKSIFHFTLLLDVLLASRPLCSFSTEVVNSEECAQLLRRIGSAPSLPPQYWLTLHCLLQHFARVCQNGSKNLLSARALGEIFSPVFFRPQASRWVLVQKLHSLLCYRNRVGSNTHSDMHTCTLAFRHTHTHTVSSVCQARVGFSSACI